MSALLAVKLRLDHMPHHSLEALFLDLDCSYIIDMLRCVPCISKMPLLYRIHHLHMCL